MRVAMISPLEMRVPPIAYGGTELVVSLLTEELVKMGNHVTLFASGDSVTSARLESVCPHYLRGSRHNSSILNMINVVSCLEHAAEFDIIHNHTTLEGMATAGLVKTPMLSTLHGGLQGDWLDLFTHYKGWYNTISHSAKSLLPEKERFVGVIYNCIDIDSYPFNSSRRKTFLLFLARISCEKGPHLAIEVAKRLKCKLVIAGNVHPVDEEYFRTMVMPEIDGDLVQYFGEADYHQKRELLSQAYCLLAPITWAEPFGLFFIEAMACGTPVVAFNRGSAPEVVKNGETGFVVETLDNMVEAVDQVWKIDREYCRNYVAKNFNVPRMASNYVSAYERILSGSFQVTDIGTSNNTEFLLRDVSKFENTLMIRN